MLKNSPSFLVTYESILHKSNIAKIVRKKFLVPTPRNDILKYRTAVQLLQVLR